LNYCLFNLAPFEAPPVSISAPSYAGKYGAALFGQRYNEATDADRVTLNLGFKKQSGQSAGTDMSSYQGGAGGGGAYGGGPYGNNPYGVNPYTAAGGAGFGGQGLQSAGHASQYDNLGLDLGITREKGTKNASGQQQGVAFGVGRR